MTREEAKQILKEWYPIKIEHIGDGEGVPAGAVLHNINSIFNYFENEVKQLKNENVRLKKQLANNHHIECNCSFCKPNYKTQLDEDLEDCYEYDRC